MKTVNLKLSKQLKEAGYPQESFFWWTEEYRQEALDRKDDWWLHWHANVKGGIASPTADEMLDQLPEFVIRGREKWKLSISMTSMGYEVLYSHKEFGGYFRYETDFALADVCAKMWLYLKKENLLSQNGGKANPDTE